MINKENAKAIVELVGGEGNITNVSHCATRLRFRLKDNNAADTEKVEKIPDVLKVIVSGGQYQVVIGPEVKDMYEEISKNISTEDGSSTVNESSSDKSFSIKKAIDLVFDVISSSFTPLLPVLAGVGVLKAIMLFLNGIGLLADGSTTMQIMTAMQNAFFYFLPIILGVSMARKLDVNPYIAATICGALLEPNLTGLVGQADVEFFGLPIIVQNYANTVFPVLIAVPLYAVLYKWLNRVIPKLVQVLVVPVLCIAIVVPLVLFVLGPFGLYVGNAIATTVTYLFSSLPLIAGALLGGLWTILVLFGLHWSVIPISIAAITTQGSDQILACAGAATFSAIGVAIGVLLKSKNKDLKALMVSGLIPLLFAGISEPVLYGATLRYKKLLYFSMISGAVGGAITGLFGSKITILFFSIFTLQTSINWQAGVIAGIITVVITIALIMIFGFGEEEVPNI